MKGYTARIEQETTQSGGNMTACAGRQTQIRDLRERLLEEDRALATAKENPRERVARLEGDVEELETGMRGLEAKLAGYTAELKILGKCNIYSIRRRTCLPPQIRLRRRASRERERSPPQRRQAGAARSKT